MNLKATITRGPFDPGGQPESGSQQCSSNGDICLEPDWWSYRV